MDGLQTDFTRYHQLVHVVVRQQHTTEIHCIDMGMLQNVTHAGIRTNVGSGGCPIPFYISCGCPGEEYKCDAIVTLS